MPTANAEGWIESEGGIRKVSVRCVFRLPSGSMRGLGVCRRHAQKVFKKKVLLPIGCMPFLVLVLGMMCGCIEWDDD